tara:strand:+ start:486 stop:683 length:198 start_codon:yes stop_codon:yes gene_type:complete
MLRPDTATNAEIRFELADRGRDEFIRDEDLRIIIEDDGAVAIRAHSYSRERTEEKRIADAIDRIE